MDYLIEWLAFFLTLTLASSPQSAKPSDSVASEHISLGVTPILFDPVSGDRVSKRITLIKTNLESQPTCYGYVTLGLYLIQDAKLPEANLAFRKALALPIDIEHSGNLHAIAYEGLGLSLMLQGNYKDAATAYQNAIELKPGVPRTYVGLGSALQKANQLEASSDAFYRALMNTNSNLSDDLRARAYNSLGEISQQKGDPSEAMRWYQQAIRTKPDYKKAWGNLLQLQQSLLRQKK